VKERREQREEQRAMTRRRISIHGDCTAASQKQSDAKEQQCCIAEASADGDRSARRGVMTLLVYIRSTKRVRKAGV